MALPPQTTLLTIAGFDPSSGAGITADLAVFAAHGFFGTSAITALTVQATLGVKSTHAVGAEILAATLQTLAEDLPPAGIKLGMLADAANTEAVAAFLSRLRRQGRTTPVVLDPVLRSSSGRALLSEDGLASLEQKLLPVVDWVTPNTAELAVLTGLPVETASQVELACLELSRRHPNLTVIATGGDTFKAHDFLCAPTGSAWFSGERMESTSTHGTGCAFSSAVLCQLVTGASPAEAVQAAKTYVTEAIRSAPGLGQGHGPMNLLWPLTRRA